MRILFMVLFGFIMSCASDNNLKRENENPCSGMYLPSKSEIISTEASKIYDLAVEEMNKGNFTESLKYFDIADSLEPNNALIVHERGLLKCNWKKYDIGLVDLKKSIELTKNVQKKYIRYENLGLVIKKWAK